MVMCPACDHENRAGVIICEQCGNDLYALLLEQISTKALDESRERALRVGESSPPSSNPIVMYSRLASEPIAIARAGKVVVGRYDSGGDSAVPDIDLGEYDAGELGVSRLHIQIDTSVHPPTITDLSSYNGTFINGQKLTPNQPYPVQSSDEVRLGRLVLRIFYK